MTARTEILEKGSSTSSAAPSQSTKSQSLSPNHARQQPSRITRSLSGHSQQDNVSEKATKYSTVRATYTGKIVIITGLQPGQFPKPKAKGLLNGKRATRGANLVLLEGIGATNQQRSPLKRKRSTTDGSGLGDQEEVGSGGEDGNAAGHSRAVSNDRCHSGSEDYHADAGHPADTVDAKAITQRKGGGSTKSNPAPKKKRRRRAQRTTDHPVDAPRPPSPPLTLLDESADRLQDVDLPGPFLSHSPSPDPDDPDDAASAIYKQLYEPLSKAESFIAALTKFNPAQRRSDVLYEIAANTAAALRVWQDEYLLLDKLTAPHAPIPRKPATGNRQLIDKYLFEDQKEADIYDYAFDAKKVGFQDPIAQKIVRDASGRELRIRGPKTRVTADNQLVKAAAVASEDDGGRRHRTRRPVTKFDGLPHAERRRRKPDGVGEEEDASKRAALSYGRGGRGRGRRGRGGTNRLLDKRIREMREESVATAASGSGSAAEDEFGSEMDGLEPLSRDASLAPSLNGSQVDVDEPRNVSTGEVKKGRPKGIKNAHPRSDKGVSKGQQPKAGTPNPVSVSPALSVSQPVQDETGTAIGAQRRPGQKQPKSEKRSESMTIWWAKRKAAAAEARRKEAEAAGLPPPVEKPRARATKAEKAAATAAQAAAQQMAPRMGTEGSPTAAPQQPTTTPYPATQVYTNGPSPPQQVHTLQQPPLHPPTVMQPVMQHHPTYSQPPGYPPQVLPPHLYHPQPPLSNSILSDPRRPPAGSPTGPRPPGPDYQDRLPSIQDISGQRRYGMYQDPMQRDPYGLRDRYEPARQYDRPHEQPLPPPPPGYAHQGMQFHAQQPQPPPPFLGYPPPPPGIQVGPPPGHPVQGQGYRPAGVRDGRDEREGRR